MGPDGKPGPINPDFESQVKESLGDAAGAEVVCTCYGGGRGGVAAGKLVAAGYEKVHNLVGGMGAWAKAELPVAGEIKPPSGH